MNFLEPLKQLSIEAGELALQLNKTHAEMVRIREQELTEDEKIQYAFWFMNDEKMKNLVNTSMSFIGGSK